MKTVISSKGQIVLPAAIRQQDGMQPGQEFEVRRIDAGEYLLKRTKRPRNEGLVDLLLACPMKGVVPFGRPRGNDRRPPGARSGMIYLIDANVLYEPT
jgi:AbrB family looped-hinge helix DNA binding protein